MLPDILEDFEPPSKNFLATPLSLILQFFKASLNLVPVPVLCIFGNHCIRGHYLRLIFFAVFDVISVISSLDFSVCEYVDAEFLYLLGETSASSLEM